MKINRIDHIVLTVANIEATIQFYTNVLSMQVIEFGTDRKALVFGNQKINLHEKGHEFEPKANVPTCGAMDICFIVDTPIEDVKTMLHAKGIEIIEGIVSKTGATGMIKSLYLRDPDNNLIELSNYE